MCQAGREIIAKKIKFLREKNNLKREELSLALGFDNSYISKLEKGRVNITIDKLDLIAKFFNINIKDLFIDIFN